MTSHHVLREGRLGIAFASTLFILACSESSRSTVVQNPAPAVEAALQLSDSAPPVGAALIVSVQAITKQGAVASYTAKINYDPAALRFDGEIAMNDAGLRASNSLPGLVRLAGAAAAGFTDGRLASYRFAVLRPNSARTLSLVVDEIHMIDRLDAKTTLTLAPNRVTTR